MNIETSEEYESIAAEYQYLMVEILDEVLTRHKITRSQRQSICSEFSFDFGMLHDQGEVKFGERQVQPMVAFLDGDTLHIRNEFFEFHEYAFGNASEYFEQNDT